MMVAMRYCQNAMPVEAMPKPPYSVGVGNTPCSTLVPAKARAATSMNRAPGTAPLVFWVEESWLIFDPFVTSFLRVTDGIMAGAPPP